MSEQEVPVIIPEQVKTTYKNKIYKKNIVMKKKEINKLTKSQVIQHIDKMKKDLFNLRFKKVNGQLQDTAKVAQIRKYIARLLTKIGNQK